MAVVSAEPRFLDAAGAVEYIRSLGVTGINRTTVRKAAYYGRRPLRRTKIGNRVYYAVDDIHAWLELCRATTDQLVKPEFLEQNAKEA